MSIASFLCRIQYSADRPEGISPPRWVGMLRWYAAREADGTLPGYLLRHLN